MVLIELLATSSVIIGLLSFGFKKYIDHQLKLKEQGQMTDLKVKADREVAVYKAKLEQESLRFNVKTSGVYEKQALVFTELYSMFADLEHDANVAINQGTPWDENYQKFRSTHIKLLTYWRRNRILLPDSIDILIQALQKDTFWLVEHYGSGESRLLHGDSEGSQEQKKKSERLKESVPQISSQLIEEFRHTIGVSEKNL